MVWMKKKLKRKMNFKVGRFALKVQLKLKIMKLKQLKLKIMKLKQLKLKNNEIKLL